MEGLEEEVVDAGVGEEGAGEGEGGAGENLVEEPVEADGGGEGVAGTGGGVVEEAESLPVWREVGGVLCGGFDDVALVVEEEAVDERDGEVGGGGVLEGGGETVEVAEGGVVVGGVEVGGVEEEEFIERVGGEGVGEELPPAVFVAIDGGGDGDVGWEAVVGEAAGGEGLVEAAEGHAAGEGVGVGLLDVEEAGGEDETLEGDSGGVASVGGAVDEAGMVEDEGVGFGREGEGPDDVGGELVGGEGGVGLLPGDGGVGRDEEGLAVDGDGEHVLGIEN